ncbi:hypothetical protein Q8F55_001389 [Vanrija albida]|uniref:Uncharacterized protein n=1 Tax=Vanrija albida TaxID=181172 RepID=A0ABR3QFV7_9TREE
MRWSGDWSSPTRQCLYHNPTHRTEPNPTALSDCITMDMNVRPDPPPFQPAPLNEGLVAAAPKSAGVSEEEHEAEMETEPMMLPGKIALGSKPMRKM